MNDEEVLRRLDLLEDILATQLTINHELESRMKEIENNIHNKNQS